MTLHAPYASAAALVRDALQLLLPPSRETVDEYALTHRFLPSRSGTGKTAWLHEEAPYLVAPMRALTQHLYLTVAVVGPAQVGKTAIGENALLHAVGQQPRNTLWYMQTDEGVEAYVKKIINQMIRMHPEMRDRLGDRPEDNAQHFKRFAGMVVEFLSATDSNLINKNAPLIIADEYDAYDPGLGDPKSRLDTRRQYYGRMSKLLAISHPDRAKGLDPVKHWDAGIMSVYADSTRFTWQWPCPHCGMWSSPNPNAKRVMTLEWPKDATLDEVQHGAHLLCPVNGCVIEDRQRRAMNIEAFRHPGLYHGWMGQGQEIAEDGTVTGDLVRNDTAGFWILGVMSNFLLNGIGGLARELVKAEKEYEISGDPKTVKEVTVKQLGVPYALTGPLGSVDAGTLAERAQQEEYPLAGIPGGLLWKDRTEKDLSPLGAVPDGVRFLTCWFDIQLVYFDVLVRGWGVDGESWVIAKDRIPAETSTDLEAWVKLLEALAVLRFPLAGDPSRGMTIRAIGYDSQGAAGTAQQSDRAWVQLRTKGTIKNFGKLDGRDLWSITPTRGVGSVLAPKLSVVYPDSQRKDRKVARTGVVPQAAFNANLFKDDLAGQLEQAQPGKPGYVHFPKGLRSKEPPHVIFEQLVSEKRDANGKWQKPHQGIRNEMLDMMVGTDVLSRLHGRSRIRDWDKPPWGWVQTWDKNIMIAPMVAPTAADPNAPKKPRSIFDIIV
jgi:phage terminase large subunit GpA-like protein